MEISLGAGRLDLPENTDVYGLFSGQGARQPTIFPWRHTRGACSQATGSGASKERIPPVMVTIRSLNVSSDQLVAFARSLIKESRRRAK